MAKLNERALSMMQVLAGAYAQGETPWGPDRELVARETAADAVLDVFATLDALRTDSPLPPNRIEHTIAMLMLIREYIVPLSSPDRKSTRLNSSHVETSYAVFCLKKKK